MKRKGGTKPETNGEVMGEWMWVEAPINKCTMPDNRFLKGSKAKQSTQPNLKLVS